MWKTSAICDLNTTEKCGRQMIFFYIEKKTHAGNQFGVALTILSRLDTQFHINRICFFVMCLILTWINTDTLVIQIEQLAERSGEESIILTASVNDGTLSHLGSQQGKGFLDGREEIKSQFLGFCLKCKYFKSICHVKDAGRLT